MRTWAAAWLGGMRVRILAVVLLLLLASSVGSVLLLRTALLAQLDNDVEQSLRRESEEFRLLSTGNDPRTGRPFDGDVASVFDVYFAREVADEGESLLAFVDGELYATRRAQDGAAAEEIRDAIGYWLSLRTQRSGELDTPAGQARYIATPIEGREVDGLFVVANFPANEREEIGEALRTQIAITVVTLVVAAAVGALLAGRVLSPLVRLAVTARRISDTDLSQRIPTRGRDEASMIAHAFNDMLSRLEEVFVSQRRFLDDTAHELRTPLTIIRGHVELLELDDSPQARSETVGVVLDEVDRLGRMVDDLFLLARSQQPGFLRWETVEVAGLARELVVLLGSTAPVEVGTGVHEGVTVRGDRQRLRQAVLQLVANSEKHAGSGARTTVEVTARGAHLVIAVVDDGVGVDPSVAGTLFERSTQGPRRDSGGGGLGLAIVRAIAEGHGGDVRLVPGTDRGARFELRVPLVGAEAVADRALTGRG